MSTSISNHSGESESYPVALRDATKPLAPVDANRVLSEQVVRIREMTRASQRTQVRRSLLFWLRIYVREPSQKRTNVRIPIPLPLIGLLLPTELDVRRLLNLQDLMERSPNPSLAVRDFLDEQMAFELVRSESKDELVLIGFD